MREHVLQVSSPSSKQTANRTCRKYVLYSQGTALRSLAGLFKVFPQAQVLEREKKSYSASYWFFLVPKQSTVLAFYVCKVSPLHKGNILRKENKNIGANIMRCLDLNRLETVPLSCCVAELDKAD